MRKERLWVAVVTEERYAAERLYAFDALALAGCGSPEQEVPAPGDRLAVVAAVDPPVLFGVGRAAGTWPKPGGPERGRSGLDGPEERGHEARGHEARGHERGRSGLGGHEARGHVDDLEVRYTHRIFDDPVRLDPPQVEPLRRDGRPLEPGLYAVTAAEFERLAPGVSAGRRTDADKSGWLVSVTLPIEASSRAEAVREFWTYIDKLGPRELPAYVWPRGNELAMQAYLLGGEANLDPEEDD